VADGFAAFLATFFTDALTDFSSVAFTDAFAPPGRVVRVRLAALVARVAFIALVDFVALARFAGRIFLDFFAMTSYSFSREPQPWTKCPR